MQISIGAISQKRVYAEIEARVVAFSPSRANERDQLQVFATVLPLHVKGPSGAGLRLKILLRQPHPYATLVAGIYSTKPGLLASPHSIDDPAIKSSEVPLAVMGIVPRKVTAENGAILPGDLLVTSSRPGYAMKGTDRRRLVGAVVGKALEPLAKGSGVIQVLVALQ